MLLLLSLFQIAAGKINSAKVSHLLFSQGKNSGLNTMADIDLCLMKIKAQSTFRIHFKKGRLRSVEDLAGVLTCNTSGYIKISQDVIMSCYITLCKV